MRLSLLRALLGATLAAGLCKADGLVNANMIQTVRLDRLPYATEQLGVVVENTDAAKTHKAYDILVPAAKHRRLASIEVRERKTGAKLRVYKRDSSTTRSADAAEDTVYRAVFNRALAPGEKIGLSVDMELVDAVRPRPEAAEQTADQSWMWRDVVGRQAYDTRKLKVVVKLGADAAVRRVDGPQSSRDGAGLVVFGPYAAANLTLAATAGLPLSVVFRDNGEQMDATEHTRECFVSHWADDLHIADRYDVRSRAPRLPTNGLDKVQQTMAVYMQGRDNLVKSLLVSVPADAREFYFVDQIGNVSTSALAPVPKSRDAPRLLQLKPRYPIPGSWRYAWRHGFSVPLSNYLRVAGGGRYSLRVPFIEHISASASLKHSIGLGDLKKNVAVLDYALRISLPEGAGQVQVETPFEAVHRIERSWYYFDVVGRPVVVIEMRNVPTHLMDDAHVVVSYSHGLLHLWVKPAAIAAFFLSLFALASVFSRLQLGLLGGDARDRAKLKKEN
ncbi:dolichyl-diphosphooligosaccharide--protein glycosyltransferase subunit 1 [Coemansia sp. RSA 2599]|nr:dolichyl-diphosphooligosaccharide--protein glycosyltransferase subunit 1 [Coemansia sp. RSA 2599]